MAQNAALSSFLFGQNLSYLGDLYAQYQANPASVDPSWAQYFDSLTEDDFAPQQPSWAPRVAYPIDDVAAKPLPPKPAKGAPAAADGVSKQALLDSLRATQLIRAYRMRGHLKAQLDPLGINPMPSHPELEPSYHGFTAADWDRPIFLDGALGFEQATLRALTAKLDATYSYHIGAEFAHINTLAERDWLQAQMEHLPHAAPLSGDDKKFILDRLTVAEGIEQFIHVKFPGTKRFGLDGGEALVPALETILKTSARMGVREAIFGMPHRGRLSVLTNIMGKRFAALFSEFQGTPANPEDVQGSGDVKYHLGASSDRDFGGETMHISLVANPSHLEAVNPVVLGKVRAKQDQRHDADRKQVMGILLHGDAAFAGQGLVAETLSMSTLKGYRTGGTMHVVVNNQIGFTTIPTNSRPNLYATDVALMINAPVFHVNGDDPEAVVRVAQMAADYRQTFQKDVVIDMVCYRRYGHNEGDEPAFTQPVMYQAIKNHTPIRSLYAQKLAAENVLAAADADAMNAQFLAHLEAEYQAASSYKPNKADWLDGKWTGLQAATRATVHEKPDTGVAEATLKMLGDVLCTVPASFNLNAKIARQMEAKAQMFKTGEGFDWATAEALAFGALMLEGNPVRLSGQDCGRGTFSQRHAVLHDQENQTQYRPLCTLTQEKQAATFEVLDSPLIEAGVLGFEYGYTLADPKALVMWEGQFGDFANGAQVLIDQFISSAESKWLRLSGLVMLLPHGYEGQGPEHSSARLERYLQLCAEDNMQVANVTTPANYFHILRRQLHRNFRKALVLMTPKSLLRHKLCVSPLAAMAKGTHFMPVIGDDRAAKTTKRVVLCSGKVYYDLWQAREDGKVQDVALVRLEQLYPFPAAELKLELAKYPEATSVVWCQEEPENMGGWTFVDRRIEAVLQDVGGKATRPVYVGRAAAASPATGSLKKHNAEQAALVAQALTV